MRILVWTTSNTLWSFLTLSQKDMVYKTSDYAHGRHDILIKNVSNSSIYLENGDVATSTDGYEIKKWESFKFRDVSIEQMYILGTVTDQEIRFICN